MAHSKLVDAVEAFMWKIHTFGPQSITPDDIRDMDNAMAMEKAHHDEAHSAVEEFVDAMNSPRGDSADIRRKRALSRLRAVRTEIRNSQESHAARIQIDKHRTLP